MYGCVPLVCLLSGNQKEGIRSLGTGVLFGVELLCGCWELDPGSLQEELVYLIIVPFLQPSCVLFFETVG